MLECKSKLKQCKLIHKLLKIMIPIDLHQFYSYAKNYIKNNSINVISLG